MIAVSSKDAWVGLLRFKDECLFAGEALSPSFSSEGVPLAAKRMQRNILLLSLLPQPNRHILFGDSVTALHFLRLY